MKLLDLGCLLVFSGFVAILGVSIYFEVITPDFQEYQVKIDYCDSRPTEIKSFIVPTGLPPQILTQKIAVPELCFCGRGIQSVKILNVCNFEILSVRYISD